MPTKHPGLADSGQPRGHSTCRLQSRHPPTCLTNCGFLIKGQARHFRQDWHPGGSHCSISAALVSQISADLCSSACRPSRAETEKPPAGGWASPRGWTLCRQVATAAAMAGRRKEFFALLERRVLARPATAPQAGRGTGLNRAKLRAAARAHGQAPLPADAQSLRRERGEP